MSLSQVRKSHFGIVRRQPRRCAYNPTVLVLAPRQHRKDFCQFPNEKKLIRVHHASLVDLKLDDALESS